MTHKAINNQAGFTILEAVIAIVIIGIAMPALVMWFSGLENTKSPEYIVQGSFVAQKKFEELASELRDTITTACPDTTPLTTSDGDYSLACVSEAVNATDPDSTTASTFGRKITLTVTRTDGAMAALVFNTLFALDS